jgi:hypothetical protein
MQPGRIVVTIQKTCKWEQDRNKYAVEDGEGNIRNQQSDTWQKLYVWIYRLGMLQVVKGHL